MSGYKIHDKQYHEAALDRNRESHARYRDQDVSEVALSSWSTSAMDAFHRWAIARLEMGEAHGFDGPAAEFWVLCDAHTGAAIDAKLINGQYGLVWLLGDEDAENYGRRFIPYNDNSRVQKRLSLKQELRVYECDEYAKAHCACIGAPMSYTAKRKHR